MSTQSGRHGQVSRLARQSAAWLATVVASFFVVALAGAGWWRVWNWVVDQLGNTFAGLVVAMACIVLAIAAGLILGPLRGAARIGRVKFKYAIRVAPYVVRDAAGRFRTGSGRSNP